MRRQAQIGEQGSFSRSIAGCISERRNNHNVFPFAIFEFSPMPTSLSQNPHMYVIRNTRKLILFSRQFISTQRMGHKIRCKNHLVVHMCWASS